MQDIAVRRFQAFLDELTGAHRNIDTVIAQSNDLVETVHTLRQIINVKGD
jgi:tRNA-splicing ligase RtcB